MSRVRVRVERTVAMLALTAFHDVMKVQALLPTVRPEHGPYEGFKAGDTINDHDITRPVALACRSNAKCLSKRVTGHRQKVFLRNRLLPGKGLAG